RVRDGKGSDVLAPALVCPCLTILNSRFRPPGGYPRAPPEGAAARCPAPTARPPNPGPIAELLQLERLRPCCVQRFRRESEFRVRYEAGFPVRPIRNKSRALPVRRGRPTRR